MLVAAAAGLSAYRAINRDQQPSTGDFSWLCFVLLTRSSLSNDTVNFKCIQAIRWCFVWISKKKETKHILMVPIQVPSLTRRYFHCLSLAMQCVALWTSKTGQRRPNRTEPKSCSSVRVKQWLILINGNLQHQKHWGPQRHTTSRCWWFSSRIVKCHFKNQFVFILPFNLWSISHCPSFGTPFERFK